MQTQLKRIRIHPIKSLTGLDVQSARFTAGGGLQNDRRWCLAFRGTDAIDPEAVYMTKYDKKEAHSKLARTRVHHESPGVLSLELDNVRSPVFQLPRDHEAAADWCSEHFGPSLRLAESEQYGFSDASVYGAGAPSTKDLGPTLISTATLDYLSESLSLSSDELFLRFRTNLLVHSDDLAPFGEEDCAEVRVGDVAFQILRPVRRCPVPARDTTTGEFDSDFANRFIDARQKTPGGARLERSQCYSASVFTHCLSPEATLLVADQ